MRGRPSRLGIVAAIVAKDLRSFAGDRLWLSITPLGLGTMIAAFWILPGSVDETVTVGIAPTTMAAPLAAAVNPDGDEQAGIEVVPFADEAALVAAIEGDGGPDLSVGIAFPSDFHGRQAAGDEPTVALITDTSVPPALSRALVGEVRELALGMGAVAQGLDPRDALPVRLPPESAMVVGEDRAGDQVSLRERMQPMLALFVLMIGAIALGGLVAVEIDGRTVRALLVTPARAGDVLVAKGITGAVLVLGQALVFLVATGSLGARPLLVLALVVLGALMMSALGMLAGAAGRDFMSTMFFGLVLFTPLMIPTFAALFPGGAAGWIRLLPSHGLVQGLVGTLGYGRGWAEAAPHLAVTGGWAVAIFGIALVVLRRRLEAS